MTITPTQADRDAAADWFTGYAGETLEAECMREGTVDHWPLVQAFARYRIAAEERGARWGIEAGADMARFAKAVLKGCGHSDNSDLMYALKKLETALRALDPKTICDSARETDDAA